ncbi:MAG: YhjD/YihY/BrkB family envelope integrity protein [Verrucomicrobiota bacterium]
MLARLIGKDLESKIGWLSGFAGSLAFFYLLSIIPFLIVILTIAHHLFPSDLTPELVRLSGNLLPSESRVSADNLVDVAKSVSGGGVITFNTLIALWTTYSFMRELVRALHFIFCEPDFISVRATPWKSVLLLVAWMLAILMTFGVFLVSPLALQLLKERIWFEFMASILWKGIQYVILFSLLYSALWLTYRLSSRQALNSRRLWQGTWIATLGWLITSVGFTWIVKRVWSQNILHGAWGSIIATLFWAYACAWSLLLGACWIRYWETKSGEKS